MWEFFFKWANFGPGHFYHWWVKVRKQKCCFIYVPHMYMISNWKVFAIKQIRFTNLSEYILNIFGAISILRIWPRTFCVRAILLSLIFCFGLIGLRSGSILKRDKIKPKAKQKIKLNNIERKQRVRGQILDKIEFDLKTLMLSENMWFSLFDCE